MTPVIIWQVVDGENKSELCTARRPMYFILPSMVGQSVRHLGVLLGAQLGDEDALGKGMGGKDENMNPESVMP